MIIYDLRCRKDHTFEGWFKDRAAFEAQKKKRLIVCPVCGSLDIEMVPSTIAVMGRDSRDSDKEGTAPVTPARALELFNEFVTKNFEDVGNRFAEVALNIHRGKENERNIKGVTTREEDELLRDEGVKFFKIPIPKFDS
ncbi:MAG: DUF1178 family protein [Deltaproteobacteria bacterium]|nr:DUF1178 family protein [Deltaproteobacteria bacterium]